MRKKYYLFKIIAAGIVTGFFNGLFGSGGGTIVVPAMVFLLGIKDQKAHATAIAVILPLSIISSFIYFRNNLIDWQLTLSVALGGMIGGYIGARLLNKIPANILRKIFGISMIAAALRMVF
jgi:uncharacterized membrane protein YfcA